MRWSASGKMSAPHIPIYMSLFIIALITGFSFSRGSVRYLLGFNATTLVLITLSFTVMKLSITIKDTDTNHPIQGAIVTITGIDWQDSGVYVPLGVTLKPTDSTGKCGLSISTWEVTHLSVEADGYETATGSMTASSAETATKTFELTPKQTETLIDEQNETPPDNVQTLTNETNETTIETPVDVSSNLTETLQTYNIFAGLPGAGILTLGTTKQELTQ